MICAIGHIFQFINNVSHSLFLTNYAPSLNFPFLKNKLYYLFICLPPFKVFRPKKKNIEKIGANRV